MASSVGARAPGRALWAAAASGSVGVYAELRTSTSEADKGMGTSEEPFDRLLREYVRDVHGVALEEGFPPPEQVLAFRS